MENCKRFLYSWALLLVAVLSSVAAILIYVIAIKKTGSLCSDNEAFLKNFLHISIKSGNVNHDSRLGVLMRTWIPVAQQINDQAGIRIIDNVQIVTDVLIPPSAATNQALALNVSMLPSHCPPGHDGFGLHCKMEYEFRQYYRSQVPQRWYCHFDDDVYVNVPNLIMALQRFDHKTPYFLGKPIETSLFDVMSVSLINVNLVFASGCGYCLSQGLMKLFEPVMKDFRNPLYYRRSAKKFRGNTGDDALVSLIASVYLNVSITKVKEFYDHIHWLGPRLDLLNETQIQQAITMPYNYRSTYSYTIPDQENASMPNDPTGFLQLHAYYQRTRRPTERICNLQ